MAEIATIARPYAEALFKASQSNLDATQAWVEELGVIGANAQLQSYVGNPNASADQVFTLISGLLKTALPAQGQNFLRTLIDNGRVSALPEIAKQFRSLKNAQSGNSDALIYSAFPLSDAQLGELKLTLEKRFARKLGLSVREDPSLIGGVRVVVGDEVLDTSVKARLEQMKAALVA